MRTTCLRSCLLSLPASARPRSTFSCCLSSKNRSCSPALTPSGNVMMLKSAQSVGTGLGAVSAPPCTIQLDPCLLRKLLLKDYGSYNLFALEKPVAPPWSSSPPSPPSPSPLCPPPSSARAPPPPIHRSHCRRSPPCIPPSPYLSSSPLWFSWHSPPYTPPSPPPAPHPHIHIYHPRRSPPDLPPSL